MQFILADQAHLFVTNPRHQMVVWASFWLWLVSETPPANCKSTLLALTYKTVDVGTFEQTDDCPFPPYLVMAVRTKLLTSQFMFYPAADRTQVVTALSARITTAFKVTLTALHVRNNWTPNGRMLVRTFLWLHTDRTAFLTNSVVTLLTSHPQLEETTHLARHLLCRFPFQSMSVWTLVVLFRSAAATCTVIIAAFVALPT